MAKTVTHVEIVTQIDTSGFDRGAKHISRAVEDIGKSVMEINSVLIASCGSVDMLLNALCGLDYSRSLITSLGIEMALLGNMTASLSLEMVLLGNTINNSAIAAASLGIALGGIASKAEGLERVADAMKDIRGAGVFMAGTSSTQPLFLETAQKRDVGADVWTKAGLGVTAAIASNPVTLVSVGLYLASDALAVGLEDKDHEKHQEKVVRSYKDAYEKLKYATPAQLDTAEKAIEAQIKDTKSAIESINAKNKAINQKIQNKITELGTINRDNVHELVSHEDIAYVASGSGENQKHKLIKQLKEQDAERKAILFLKGLQSSEPGGTPSPTGSLKGQGTGDWDKIFSELLKENRDNLAAAQQKSDVAREQFLQERNKLEQERKIHEAQVSLVWQNSRGMLSDADTEAGLQKIFIGQQAALLAAGIDPTDPSNWPPAMRSNYDQQLQLRNKELNNTQANLIWQNNRGMLSNTDTLAGLQEVFDRWKNELLALGLDPLDPVNWTPEMRANFDQQIQVITKELNPALESLREQYENNNLTVEDYQTKLAELKETYTGYPEMLQLITAEETKLAEAQRMAAESKSNTTAIIEQAYNDIQKQLDDLAGNTLVQLGDSFAAAIVKGESLGDSLKKLGDDILYLVARAMMLKMLSSIFSSLFGGSGSVNITPYIIDMEAPLLTAHGNVFGPHGLQRFARGGIVGQPTLFGFARGIGLMGEAGPEAIMPLGRDGRGNLGVRIADSAMYGSGASTGVFAPHIEINIENSGGGDMTDEQARALGTQINAAVEMQVAKQMYDYARSGIFRSGAGRGY